MRNRYNIFELFNFKGTAVAIFPLNVSFGTVHYKMLPFLINLGPSDSYLSPRESPDSCVIYSKYCNIKYI